MTHFAFGCSIFNDWTATGGLPSRDARPDSIPGHILKAPAQRPGWLRVDRLWGEMGIRQDTASGRRQFEKMMEEWRRRDEPGEGKAIRRGWCLGEEWFRQELLEVMSEPMGRQYYGGAERQETEEAKPQRVVAEELKRRKWDRKELKKRRKGDKEKVKMACRLRRETTMTLDWIAQRLAMGVASYAAQCLRKAERKKYAILRD